MPFEREALPLRYDKSQTSYPHWPPTTHKEAVAQFKCLIGELYPHRMYLANCWMTSLNIKLAAAEPQPSSKETIERVIWLVQENCRITDGNEPERGNMKRRRRICDDVCNPVLLARRPYCLNLQLRVASGGVPGPSDIIGWKGSGFFFLYHVSLFVIIDGRVL